MGKYIKKFTTHAEYQSYISGSGAYLPNVSTCDDEATHVHYNPEPLYRTVSGDPFCNGYDKYVEVESQVSYDNGRTWETTATTQVLVEKNSADCGYVNDKLTVTYDVITTSEDTALFDSYYGNSIVGVEIDGVELSTVQNTYRFNTIGEHTVRYTLHDPSSISARCFRPDGPDLRITRYSISEEITSIEYGALQTSLDSFDIVVYSNTPPEIAYSIGSEDNISKIYVPAESVDIYKAEWSRLANKIVAL